MRYRTCEFEHDETKRAELAMHTENLERSSLSPAEEAYAVRRAKALYEEIHPETKVGATGGRGSKTKNDFASLAKSNDAPPPRFTAAMSAATGKSEPTRQLLRGLPLNVSVGGCSLLPKALSKSGGS